MPLLIADAMSVKKHGEMSLRERLQTIREARGLTLVQLAEARRQWRGFQWISALPERDEKAAARLIQSLVVAAASRSAAL